MGAVVGLAVLARLPRLNHWLFESSEFEQVTDDAFFISIASDDPLYERAGTRGFLEEIGALHVTEIEPVTVGSMESSDG